MKLLSRSSIYQHKITRRATWHAPNGKTHYQSNIPHSGTQTIIQVQYQSGPDQNTPMGRHRQWSWSRNPKPKIETAMYKVSNKDAHQVWSRKNKRSNYMRSIPDRDWRHFRSSELNRLRLKCDHNQLNSALHESAERVLGKQRKALKRWVSKNILDLCDERRLPKKSTHSKKELTNITQPTNIIHKVS